MSNSTPVAPMTRELDKPAKNAGVARVVLGDLLSFTTKASKAFWKGFSHVSERLIIPAFLFSLSLCLGANEYVLITIGIISPFALIYDLILGREKPFIMMLLEPVGEYISSVKNRANQPRLKE